MVAVYTATRVLGSLLLFLVGPMVGKMLLPKPGGTPAVWNTCMVCFPAMLLAGYTDAHATTRWLGVRRQAGLQLAVLVGPIALLPVAVAAGVDPPGDRNPIPWRLWQRAVSVGPVFFVVSTAPPLPPPNGMPTTAHLHVIRNASVLTSSRLTCG